MSDLRETRGWSRRRLAAELGVDHATIGRWEAGASHPTPALRARLIGLLGSAIPMPPTLLGAEVRDLRYRSGLSQADLARRLGMTQPTLSKIENGVLEPGPELVRILREEVRPAARIEELRTATLGECEESYAAYWRSCAVFDHPDGAAWGAMLSRRLDELAENDPRARPLPARVFASRSYWYLVRSQHRDVERMARSAIEIGAEVGFDLTSGYAFWAWTRSRLNKRRISAADRSVVRALRALSRRRIGADLPYAELVSAAHDRVSGRIDEADEALNKLSHRKFPEREPGQFGELDAEKRWATVQSYRAMFHLATGKEGDVIDLAQSVAHEDPVLTLIFGAYRNAALARMGAEGNGIELAAKAEIMGHGFAYQTVLDHTRKIAGVVL